MLLRRGGIREGPFKCGSDNAFVLFPTGYHTDPELCKPGTATPYHDSLDWDPKFADSVPIYGVAQVCSQCSNRNLCTTCHVMLNVRYLEVLGDMQAVDQFTTTNADVFHMLQDLHIWTDSFYTSRLGRRAGQPITAILLHAWRFEEPVILPQSDSYWGCFSWCACL